ncbi:LOW QUALITY PROTEIN: hypothetical protein BJ085DRAFT_43653 [Dimargaris cristalligena]|uniref:Homing endonuclease LAGLIDADG domain-containing protein n=1 Tax=Dimargaris cristalligena TaxID=215637 RepID=A0A4Q0A0N3_9FUNG|nr:LOW QUALITY PROTEIN: hypothetical protein BJ085DRAFT_43653 [Dimargaris cristalligena]|eukprot:RKP39554.1 LOW QUALITY PROTEIN: hypothetical protein BJ085DRAFT_43653 [Dimargaris cristalligena]
MLVGISEAIPGLIDGNGCFQLSKKGYASIEIVMELKDKHCLYLIKDKFGGSIKLRSGVNHLRYRMHHKKVRLNQLNNICVKYDIPFISPCKLNYDNAGLIDSEVSQKNSLLLEPLIKIKLIPKYFVLRTLKANRATENSVLGKA